MIDLIKKIKDRLIEKKDYVNEDLHWVLKELENIKCLKCEHYRYFNEVCKNCENYEME